MLCKKCNEEVIPGSDSPVPGVCYDCYAIYDMERLIASPRRVTSRLPKANAPYTPQESPEDTSHTQEGSSPEPLPEKPPLHTNPLTPDQLLLLEEGRPTLEELDEIFLAVMGMSTQELLLQQSQSSADKADK